MELIICKSEAFKIDLFTEDNFRKTAIGYFKTQDQKDLKEYAFKNNIGVLLTGGLWRFELEELRKRKLQQYNYGAEKNDG